MYLLGAAAPRPTRGAVMSPDVNAPVASRLATPLVAATERLEQSTSLDGLRRVYATVAGPVDRWSGSDLLRSGLIGHALHPRSPTCPSAAGRPRPHSTCGVGRKTAGRAAGSWARGSRP